MPEEAFRQAVESHGANNPVIRMGMYVPTRSEVATMDPTELLEILDLWIWESPTELIPRAGMIDEVRDVLRSRPDGRTEAVQEIIALCDDYLRPE